MKIYYAHCMAIYDTPQEKRDIAMLEALGFTVENPNTPEHQAGCQAVKDGPLGAMWYFKDVVLGCDAVAFRALPDGAIAAGVALEVEWMRDLKGGPIIELPSSLLRRGLTVEQTREVLRESGRR